ncbi:TonB-dependent receptor [Methylomonas sp. EFPC3]|uniref:TonB-dependent receptor plug domain-containing protein n=1 Tax=Methylomonas sp. EFPC3 TaxID=3021710 RepID=UPI002416FFF7|nr:TonB-dependent receptor [Methylomonas sp. EFPC3]WFP51361.1 TonB-dependent receptor [Methylomonas sp. EFPC3]
MLSKAHHPLTPATLALVVAWSTATQLAEAANQSPEEENLPDLTALSVEQLLNLDVTSVMKTSTDVSHVPAAIYVLSNEDIRRSGATTIPEALRVVPGLNVAKVDGNKWAVSVRGFNTQFANKLLVLVDGRSVYNPLFSGVWWDQQDVMMEDIERIEVIRGPGASLWGANAVNGVINIITKTAKNTQGTLLSGQVGTQRYGGGVRYGADLGDEAYLKVYARHSNYGDSRTRESSHQAGDEGDMSKVGFRYDKAFDIANKLSIQGDAFIGDSNGAPVEFPALTANLTPVMAPPYSQLLPANQQFSGHYLQGRWEHHQGTDSTTVVRMYWDRHSRKSPFLNSQYQIDSFDIDFQHNYKLDDRHLLLWGAGLRFNLNDFENSPQISMSAPQRTDRIYSFFVQDEISLVPDRWRLTLGGKVEHNPVTHFEVQPNARLLWTPDDRNSFWASVSRSVRTPNWVEQNISYSLNLRPPQPGLPVPMITGLVGNPNLEAEKMLGFELGWRGQITPQVSADIALYHYNYDDFTSYSISNSFKIVPPASYVLVSTGLSNLGIAEVYGGEVSLDWQVSDKWKLKANYSHEEDRVRPGNGVPASVVVNEGSSYPVHKAMLWSMYDLTPQLKLDLNWRFVSSTVTNQSFTRGYQDLDARLAWDLGSGLELALVGRNLLDSYHFEYGSDLFSTATAVQREVYGTLRWQF